MIDVITILGFIAAVYVIIILAVILAVWRAAGEQARPVYERYDPARHEFPRDVSAWLEANANALSREGFAVAGDLVRLGPPTTQRVLLIMNDVTEERGMVAAVLGSKGGGGMFVEFTAERPDGRALEVSNTGGPRVFAAAPGWATERFPGVRDPARLLRVFRALLRQRWGSAALTYPDVQRDPAGYLSAATFRQMSLQVETGYFRLDPETHTFKRTLKGAVLMTCKLLPPFRQVLVARQERRAARCSGRSVWRVRISTRLPPSPCRTPRPSTRTTRTSRCCAKLPGCPGVRGNVERLAGGAALMCEWR